MCVRGNADQMTVHSVTYAFQLDQTGKSVQRQDEVDQFAAQRVVYVELLDAVVIEIALFSDQSCAPFASLPRAIFISQEE